MKEILLEIVWWTWCLPQTLIGFILNLIFKGDEKTVVNKMKKYIYYNTTLTPGSISLGKYILLCDSHHDDIDTIEHEHGHQVQSLILGPLYLLVIGLPSLIWCGCFEKYREKHNISYYSFYTESWAENLALVRPLSVIEAICLNVRETPWFYFYEVRDTSGNILVGGSFTDILDSQYRINTVMDMLQNKEYDLDVYTLIVETYSE